jgi:hypothetical protein
LRKGAKGGGKPAAEKVTEKFEFFTSFSTFFGIFVDKWFGC